MGSFCPLCSKAALAALPNAFFRDDDAANFSQESHGGGGGAATAADRQCACRQLRPNSIVAHN